MILLHSSNFQVLIPDDFLETLAHDFDELLRPDEVNEFDLSNQFILFEVQIMQMHLMIAFCVKLTVM